MFAWIATCRRLVPVSGCHGFLRKTGQKFETIILFSLQFLWNARINWIRFVMETGSKCVRWISFSSHCTMHCAIKHWITCLVSIISSVTIWIVSVNEDWNFNKMLNSNINWLQCAETWLSFSLSNKPSYNVWHKYRGLTLNAFHQQRATSRIRYH